MEAVFDVPVLILKLSRQYEHEMTTEQLYERTRGFWVINPVAHRSVNYAMPIAVGGVIREVYRILRWTEIDMWTIEESPLRQRGLHAASKTRYRWRFDGTVDETMRQRYLGRLVPDVAASQNPALWRGPSVTNLSGPAIVKLSRSE
jgi:hypothetical protein